jgi:hypothetical protein
VDSDCRFGNFLQLSAFGSKDKASLTDSFSISAEKGVLGGSPFYQYGSGSGNASPHGHLPLDACDMLRLYRDFSLRRAFGLFQMMLCKSTESRIWLRCTRHGSNL